MTRSIRDAAAAIVALVAVMAAAYGLDNLVHQLRLRASSSFDFMSVLWIPPLANVALAAGLAALIWWLLARAARPRWIGLLFLLVGLSMTLYLPITMTLGVPRNLPLLDPAFFASSRSYWGFTGAALAVAGALSVARPTKGML
jgi:hypothetical protein